VLPDTGSPAVVFCMNEFGPLNLQTGPTGTGPRAAEEQRIRRFVTMAFTQEATDALRQLKSILCNPG
jgi:hypothetical protein